MARSTSRGFWPSLLQRRGLSIWALATTSFALAVFSAQGLDANEEARTKKAVSKLHNLTRSEDLSFVAPESPLETRLSAGILGLANSKLERILGAAVWSRSESFGVAGGSGCGGAWPGEARGHHGPPHRPGPPRAKRVGSKRMARMARMARMTRMTCMT